VPLLLCSILADRAKGSAIVPDTLASVIQRADEPAEFLAIRCRLKGAAVGGLKDPGVITHGIRKGLARALLGSTNTSSPSTRAPRDAIKLRDVLRLVRPLPTDERQSELWDDLRHGRLARPDTWESALAGGADKKAVFTRLLEEGKLGYLALLRNLRGMRDAGVDRDLVRQAILARRGGADKVFPFRFIAAAKAAPEFEPELDQAFVGTLSQAPRLSGKTVALIDVSGSMYHGKVSAKSDMDRVHAACALAAILREVCEVPAVYATAGSDATRIHQTAPIPARRGMALVDAIHAMTRPLGGGGIFLAQSMEWVRAREKTADRVIVFTDEQDCSMASHERPDAYKPWGDRNYLINVATYKHGIAYGPWVHVDGFSEKIVDFVLAYEDLD
jgi:60 kDa SS-A/Ro ribonucleoprotein